MAWLPDLEHEGFLAIGHTNGRVLLTSILGSDVSCPFNGQEYTSKHNRQCNVVAWGVVKPHLLLGGFDKHRSESGLMMWDVGRTGHESTRPLMEAAFGDSVSSVAWFNHLQTIVAGVNNKNLRIYDARGDIILDFSKIIVVFLLNKHFFFCFHEQMELSL